MIEIIIPAILQELKPLAESCQWFYQRGHNRPLESTGTQGVALRDRERVLMMMERYAAREACRQRNKGLKDTFFGMANSLHGDRVELTRGQRFHRIWQ